MSDTIVKTEIVNDNESSMNSNDSSLPDLTELLNEVKKESFFDDTYREELEADSPEATTDVDNQKLEEILAKKKKILEEAGTSTRKRKDHNELRANDDNQQNTGGAKRSRKATDTHEDNLETRNKSPIPETSIGSNNSNQQKCSAANNDGTTAAEEPTDAELEFENLFKTEDYNNSDEEKQKTEKDGTTASEEPTDAELEFENLFKTEDYNNTNEEQSNSNQMTLGNNMQGTYQFPNAMPMIPTMYNPSSNQMMGNMAFGGFPMMYNNMGYSPGFYPPNMMNMQMMGCGIPQMNVPSNSNEVECLPVVSKFPTFKPIKLENKSKVSNEENQGEALSAEERKRKVLEGCIHLLSKMKSSDSTGKFAYTSTVTKVNTATVSNSILLKITNVSYNFQSIGPKLNIQDWGLREISNNNIEIAKKISMSADKYFNKIEQSTMVKKMIKTENAKVDNQAEAQMEEEEPSLSTYLKNSMTQTDALVCGPCVARKRVGMHEIAVQATVFTGSIGCQTTDSNFKFYEILMKGLSENQMKAIYEFSTLIRKPPRNTPGDIMKLREDLLKMYNLSQQQYKGPVPPVDASSFLQNTNINPRVDPRSISDPRRFPNPGLQIQSVQSLAKNNSTHLPHRMQNPDRQMPRSQFPGNTRNNQQGSSQDRPMQIPNQQMGPGRQQDLPGQVPVHTRNDHEHPRGRIQDPAMQRHHGHRGQAPQFSGHPIQGHPIPELPNQQFAPGSQQEVRKMYGRGGLRR